MKKYARSMTKVASRAIRHESSWTFKSNEQVAQHREKAKAYRKHWTASRSAYAHREAFNV
jgi:hypothetical protein